MRKCVQRCCRSLPTLVQHALPRRRPGNHLGPRPGDLPRRRLGNPSRRPHGGGYRSIAPNVSGRGYRETASEPQYLPRQSSRDGSLFKPILPWSSGRHLRNCSESSSEISSKSGCRGRGGDGGAARETPWRERPAAHPLRLAGGQVRGGSGVCRRAARVLRASRRTSWAAGGRRRRRRVKGRRPRRGWREGGGGGGGRRRCSGYQVQRRGGIGGEEGRG